ncbi:hypothetical protein [Pseudescherichia vulneris]|uniref:hypothetical protein n=1 Tax=Pseudescherichia vulneris TaxID=566 RepID=UPI001EDD0B58|nr:hypothetical protein [Pseudescherichia vulneris]
MMLIMLKDVLSIPVISSIIFAFIAAISRQYTHFNRRDFFSRTPAEQVKAVKWLAQLKASPSDPLAIAEQQFRLQSFGLHRDKDLSVKLIAFHSSTSATHLPSLKTVLRWPGLYILDEGKIHLRKQVKWFLPLMMVYLIFILGTDIVKNYATEDTYPFFLSLSVSIVAVSTWCWMITCALKVSGLSKKLNAYSLPAPPGKNSSDDFSSILNDR